MTRRASYSLIVLLAVFGLQASLVSGQSGATYDLSHNVIASGGQQSTGGTFKVEGTMGQPAAGTASAGGPYGLRGGFWAFVPPPVAPTSAPADISGVITLADGRPLGGVTVRLNGSSTARTITDANGYYRFDNVPTEGFYTVMPELVNYSFNPGSRSFSLVGDKTDAVFTALSDPGHHGNAIDTPEFFVRQHYLDFLRREPDAPGFNFWSNQIHECGLDQNCVDRRREHVSAAYFLSIEFQQTGGLVDGLYRISFGRRPQYVEFIPDIALVGQNVIVGTIDWQERLAANRKGFAEAFVQRPAFRQVYDGVSGSRFVDELIGHTGINFAQSKRDELVNGLTDGTLTRAEVLLRIAEDEQFVNAKRNQMFVMMEYFGYLGRDPDESGYQFWLQKLNQFNGDFQRAEMVRAFILSTEYRARFQR